MAAQAAVAAWDDPEVDTEEASEAYEALSTPTVLRLAFAWIEAQQPEWQQHKPHAGEHHCSGCPPSPWCACCGRPAVTSTQAGGQSHCAVSWCDRCMLDVLRCRGQSMAESTVFLRNFEPLEFLALDSPPPTARPHPLPAMVSSEPRKPAAKKPPGKPKKPPKERQRLAPVVSTAATQTETREPQHQSSVAKVNSKPARRRVTSRSVLDESLSCDEPNISRQVRSTGRRISRPRRAPAKGA